MAKVRRILRPAVVIALCFAALLAVFGGIYRANPTATAQVAWKQPPRTSYDNIKLATLEDGSVALTVSDLSFEILSPAGITIGSSDLPGGKRVWNVTAAQAGGFYIGTVPAGVIAYSNTGDELWTHSIRDDDYTRVFEGPDGLVYCVTWKGMPATVPTRVTVLNPGGGLVSEFDADAVPSVFNAVAVNPAGGIYLVTDKVDTNIHSYNLAGELKWSERLHRHPDQGRTAHKVGQVGAVYAGRDLVAVSLREVGIIALSPQGELWWKYQSPNQPGWNHPLHYGLALTGDSVVTSYREELVGLDPSGKQLWVRQLPGFITELNLVGDDVYVETNVSSESRYWLAGKLMQVNKDLAADVRNDRVIHRVGLNGELFNSWLLPPGTILRTMPDDLGRAYGTYNVEQRHAGNHLVRLDLLR